MRVVKNTVASVAFDKGQMKGLGARLAGPSAVIFGGEGVLAISKLVAAEVQTNKKLKIHGGYADGEVLDAKGIDTLSKVPSKPELLSMTLSRVLRAGVGALAQPGRAVHRDERADRGPGKDEAGGGIRGLKRSRVSRCWSVKWQPRPIPRRSRRSWTPSAR